MLPRSAQSYVEYLQSHTLGLRLCMLFSTEGIQELKASAAAQSLKSAIQTVTNGLHNLERDGILQSDKRGVTRFYSPRNRATLNEALESIRGSGFRAPRLGLVAMDILKSNLTQSLFAKARGNNAEAERGVKFETSLGEVAVDYLVKLGKHSHVIELTWSAEFESAVGRAYLLSLLRKSRQVNSVTFVMFPDIRHDGLRVSRLLPRHFRDELGTWISFLFEPRDNYTLTRPDYAKDLVDKVWQGFVLNP
ncbi:MAG: hypothetical protein HY296_08515 [Thaumarchaeota archaeon]|nr:hypothetical protein [Nitrososphaerota archaeon]